VPWVIEDILRDWMPEGVIALAPHVVVAAFNRAETVLGRDWVEACGANMRGPISTLSVVRVGQMLAALDGVAGREMLVNKLRQHDSSAMAELTALHFLRGDRPHIEAQVYPRISIGSGYGEPDLRVREGQEPWTYVEVAQPNQSEAHERAQSILQRLTSVVSKIEKSFALEVFLRREPTDGEVDELVATLPDFCGQDGTLRGEVRDLAILILNYSPPGQVVPYNHAEDDGGPRLGMATSIVGGGAPTRHVAVRMPYADERAESFLNSESKQLPKDAPGIIVVTMGGAPGGMKVWQTLLRRRLQPSMHTRVGAVRLVSGGVLLMDNGLSSLTQTDLILNPYAALPVPAWIVSALRQAGAPWEEEMRRKNLSARAVDKPST
jgi:hypothetical protein